jgi:hypothetical protein
MLTDKRFAMGPNNQNRKEDSSPLEAGYSHYSSPIEERVEILAQDPVRFFLSQTVWCERGEQRIDILEGYLEHCIKTEKYELCIRIREVQRLLLQKIWRDKNPVRPEEGPVRVYCIISGTNIYDQVHEVECDLADNPGKVFRSLEAKKPREFIRPLVLKPDSPDIPMMVYSSFPFTVEQICITRATRRVENISKISLSKSGGPFIQSFTGHEYVIIAPVGFIEDYEIEVGVTSVDIRNVVPF